MAGIVLSTALAAAARGLEAAGIEAPRREAAALAVAVLGLARERLVAEPGLVLAPEAAARLAAAVERRAAREPFARIAGVREFWSLDFALSPETLVPRPETETVVEAVLDAVADRDAALSILDLGTGSGCILLALLSELPNARGLGIDIAPGAVATARANAERLGFEARAAFRMGDWGAGLEGPFDVIVANPPYVAEGERAALAPEVRDFDPPAALFAGPRGLDVFPIIARALPRLLAPGGLAALECGAGQASEVAGILELSGLLHVAFRRDLSGIERVVTARAPGAGKALECVKKSVGKRGVPV